MVSDYYLREQSWDRLGDLSLRLKAATLYSLQTIPKHTQGIWKKWSNSKKKKKSLDNIMFQGQEGCSWFDPEDLFESADVLSTCFL